MKGEFTRNWFSFLAPSSDATITTPKWIPHALAVFMSAIHRWACPSWHFSGPKEISGCPCLTPFLMHHTTLQDHHTVFSSHHCPCHQHLRSSSYTPDLQLT